MYIFLTAIPLMFRQNPPSVQGDLFSYDWSDETWGLTYLVLGAGLMTSAFGCGPLQDWIHQRLTKKHGAPQPEFTLPLAIGAMVILPLGCLMVRSIVELFPNAFIDALIAGLDCASACSFCRPAHQHLYLCRSAEHVALHLLLLSCYAH